MLEEDKVKDSGATGNEDAIKKGGVKENSQEEKKDKVGDGQSGNAVRGATTGRLLVRGGFWEVQVIFAFIVILLIKRVMQCQGVLCRLG